MHTFQQGHEIKAKNGLYNVLCVPLSLGSWLRRPKYGKLVHYPFPENVKIIIFLKFSSSMAWCGSFLQTPVLIFIYCIMFPFLAYLVWVECPPFPTENSILLLSSFFNECNKKKLGIYISFKAFLYILTKVKRPAKSLKTS